MRTRKWYAVTFIALVILAGRGVHADFRAGSYTTGGPATIHQMLPNITSTDATYDAGPYPIYEPELAAGDGKQEVETYCNTCHSPRYITMQPPLPAGAWADEVNKMVRTYDASVPQDDERKIIEYLQSHYTIETRKR